MRARKKKEPLGISRPLTALYWVAIRVTWWGHGSVADGIGMSHAMIHCFALVIISRHLQLSGNEGLTGGGPASNSLALDEGDDRGR